MDANEHVIFEITDKFKDICRDRRAAKLNLEYTERRLDELTDEFEQYKTILKFLNVTDDEISEIVSQYYGF